jgi:hypothetical protein
MTHIEDPHTFANGLVLRDESAGPRIFDRHFPSAELNHFRAHGAVRLIERGFV